MCILALIPHGDCFFELYCLSNTRIFTHLACFFFWFIFQIMRIKIKNHIYTPKLKLKWFLIDIRCFFSSISGYNEPTLLSILCKSWIGNFWIPIILMLCNEIMQARDAFIIYILNLCIKICTLKNQRWIWPVACRHFRDEQTYSGWSNFKCWLNPLLRFTLLYIRMNFLFYKPVRLFSLTKRWCSL